MLEICQARKLAETKQQTQGRKATASSTSYLEREVDRKPQANYTPDYRTSDKYGERLAFFIYFRYFHYCSKFKTRADILHTILIL